MPTRITEIVRLDAVVENLAWKPAALPNEAEEVLRGHCRIFRREGGSVEGEDMYDALGETRAGGRLSVFFVRKAGKKALVATAREMSRRERRHCE